MSTTSSSDLSTARGLSIQDFQLTTKWQEIQGPDHQKNNAAYIKDTATGRIYKNEPTWSVRGKCLGLVVLTPILYTLGLVYDVAERIKKLVTFYHFRVYQSPEYTSEQRFKDAGMNLLKIVLAPITLLGLELAAIYGVFNPNDGKRIFAAFERFQFEEAAEIKGFQPIVLKEECQIKPLSKQIA